MINLATTMRADFFTALVCDADSGGLLELRALPSKVQDFFSPCDFESIERFIVEHSHENVYFGVATRRDCSSGALANCGALGALFVDIDSTSAPEARARLYRFPLKPSIVVASGGGLHGYYLLREPIDLQAPGEAERAKSLLRRLARALGGDLSAAEPARVLRVPDTWNHKYTPARPVTIEAFNA